MNSASRPQAPLPRREIRIRRSAPAELCELALDGEVDLAGHVAVAFRRKHSGSTGEEDVTGGVDRAAGGGEEAVKRQLTGAGHSQAVKIRSEIACNPGDESCRSTTRVGDSRPRGSAGRAARHPASRRSSQDDVESNRLIVDNHLASRYSDRSRSCTCLGGHQGPAVRLLNKNLFLPLRRFASRPRARGAAGEKARTSASQVDRWYRHIADR